MCVCVFVCACAWLSGWVGKWVGGWVGVGTSVGLGWGGLGCGVAGGIRYQSIEVVADEQLRLLCLATLATGGVVKRKAQTRSTGNVWLKQPQTPAPCVGQEWGWGCGC